MTTDPTTPPAPAAPAAGDFLARDGAFYTITGVSASLDGPLFEATTEDPALVPARLVGKLAELRPAGRAGTIPIWSL